MPAEGVRSCEVTSIRSAAAASLFCARAAAGTIAASAKAIAEKTLNFFRPAVFDHHKEEEKDLFPAVLSAADKGEERAKVQAMADSLTAEHRAMEAMWRELEPQLTKLANGHIGAMDTALVDRLVEKYQAHARLEEQHFLPLAEVIRPARPADGRACVVTAHAACGARSAARFARLVTCGQRLNPGR